MTSVVLGSINTSSCCRRCGDGDVLPISDFEVQTEAPVKHVGGLPQTGLQGDGFRFSLATVSGFNIETLAGSNWSVANKRGKV